MYPLIPTVQPYQNVNGKTHKMHMESQATQIAKVILKKNKIGDLTLPDFRAYHKVTVIKAVWW